MTPYEEKAWKLKHKLIVESINRCHDFNLDEINAEVRRRLGEPEACDKIQANSIGSNTIQANSVVKESLTVQPELKRIWKEIDEDWAARHKRAALAVKELVKNDI